MSCLLLPQRHNPITWLVGGGLLLTLAMGNVRAEPVVYLLDTTHTFVTWEVKHFGTSTSRGRFPVKAGSITIDWDKQSASTEVTIDVAHPDTGVAALDDALKGDDYFDVQNYPEARFVARDFRIDDRAVTELKGALTLKKTTRSVALTATGFNCYFSVVFRRRVCGGDFEANLLRSDFDVRGGLPFIADQVHLLIQVEAPTAPRTDSGAASAPSPGN